MIIMCLRFVFVTKVARWNSRIGSEERSKFPEAFRDVEDSHVCRVMDRIEVMITHEIIGARF